MATSVIKPIFSIAFCAVAAGCAASPELVSQFSYPQNPPQVDVIKIQVNMASYLKDPYSAQINFGAPYHAYLKKPLIAGGGMAWYGWAVDANINAKNSFGAYTGFRPYHVMFMFTGDVYGVIEAQPVDLLFYRAP